LRQRFGPADARVRDAVQRTVRFYLARGDTAHASAFRVLLKPGA
jgi:hypothetical protein